MSEKTHLLFFIPSLRYGGAERVVANLSRVFIESGKYRISIILLEDGADYSIPGNIEMLRLHYAQPGILNKTHSLIFDPFILKDFVVSHKVDIVLSFMQRPNVINLLSKVLGSKHLSYVNVRVCLTKQYENIPGPFRLISRLLLKWLWRYSDRTIVNSQVIKNEIVSLFNINPQKVNVVYNPLNIKEIGDWSKEAVDEDWFNKKDASVVINVGRLTRQKGHIYLLKAIAHLSAKRPVRLAIVGDGELKTSLIKRAKELGVADRVLFMGWQKNPYKYIKCSDVFVLSSLWEGFPNVVLEAMACHCPVVVADCLSGPSEILLPQEKAKRDIIETKYGILVNNPTVINLSKAIERMLNNRDKVKEYTEAGFERASQFTLSSIAEDYEKTILKGLQMNEVAS